MLTEAERGRYKELRRLATEGSLTAGERDELSSLTREIERWESAYLGPATQRLREDSESIETQNRSLEALARRKEALVERLRRALNESEAEQYAISQEVERILGDGGASLQTVR